MSGMVGLFRRDGSPVEESSVQTMLESIRHRGPDRSRHWTLGPVGFGQAMLWTTPESLHEVLPWRDSSSGLSITADARIDNRDELIAALGLRGSVQEISDSRLILHAYEKWGEACPQRLIGDFVFAIWDQRRHHLFCARDPMGVKGLYYYASKHLFAFASEIKGLCSLREIPAQLNELRILDYLANIFEDRAITFYKDIYRLPAASTLTVDENRSRASKYWMLDTSKELKLRSDGEYAEAFRECFLKSVKSRMRSAYPVGAALSGGLDSSSIACAARDFNRASGATTPVRTFSLIFPSLPDKVRAEIDERTYMDDVLKQGGFQPFFISADKYSPLRHVEQIQKHLDEAYFAGNLYLHWAMYETANKQGVRIFLDGMDGDTTVSHGLEYFSDLAVSGKWVTLRKEVQLLAARMNTSPRRIIREYCIKPFCPTWVYTAWRRLHGRRPDAGTLPTFVTSEFSKRLKLEERVKSLISTNRKCFTTAREKHHAMIMFPLYAHALEVADKSSAAFGIEARYPFFDQRLIELCLSLPAGQKFSHGWSRSVLRRAMAGILPESVRWRQTKANLSPNFYIRLLDYDREILDDVIVNDSADLQPYVDLDSIRRAYQAYTSNPLRCHDESVNIFSAVNLAIWLRHGGVRP